MLAVVSPALLHLPAPAPAPCPCPGPCPAARRLRTRQGTPRPSRGMERRLGVCPASGLPPGGVRTLWSQAEVGTAQHGEGAECH